MKYFILNPLCMSIGQSSVPKLQLQSNLKATTRACRTHRAVSLKINRNNLQFPRTHVREHTLPFSRQPHARTPTHTHMVWSWILYRCGLLANLLDYQRVTPPPRHSISISCNKDATGWLCDHGAVRPQTAVSWPEARWFWCEEAP